MSSFKTEGQNNRVGVLMPGLGAVSTTFMAGVEAVRRGLASPVGSLCEMGRVPVMLEGKASLVPIREMVSLSSLESLCFGGWDIVNASAYDQACRARVLEPKILDEVSDFLRSVEPFRAVHDSSYVSQIEGGHVKTGKTKWDLVCQLKEDIQSFRQKEKCDRLVMVWCGSTEKYHPLGPSHDSLPQFEAGLKENDPLISPSQMYAYAAISEGVPYANGSPNRSVEIGALQEFSNLKQVPIAGSDFKTGQTLIKTILAPGLRSRLLGLSGWYSTNILGNRDGEVLSDPEAFRAKEISKLSVLDQMLDKDAYPQLYGDICHRVSIHYYPPRGDNKEGWDNIDIFGWLGYPMQVKVNFLCRDSILAAPLVLDLVLFLDLAARSGLKGPQEWLSFYFKTPLVKAGDSPVHSLFRQEELLFATIQRLSPQKESPPLHP